MEPSPAPPFHFVDDPASYRCDAGLVVRIPAAARGKQKLLGALASRLRFPRYFGNNWDALEECLRDLSWLGEVPRVTIVHERLPFAPRGASLTTYLRLLIDVVADRRASDRSPTLEVVFPTWAAANVSGSLSDKGS